MENNSFEEWCVLELFGHRRLAGKVTDAVIGGASFIRIDIPAKDGKKTTQFYSPAAVYAITPTTEELATIIAVNSQPEPVNKWEIRSMLESGKESPYEREGMPELVHDEEDTSSHG
jgi:hypothetical protein